MEQLADNVQIKSISQILEIITEQVAEISLLTEDDFRRVWTDVGGISANLAEAIVEASHQFCDVLNLKFKQADSTVNHPVLLKNVIESAEDVSHCAMQLAHNVSSFEVFQDKTAQFLEAILEAISAWDGQVVSKFLQGICDMKKPLMGLMKTQSTHEVLPLYKEFVEQCRELCEQLCLRVEDLIDRKVQVEYWVKLSCIRNMATSFSRVLKNTSRYPSSRHSRVSRDYVIKELLYLLGELEHLLKEPGSTNEHWASFVNAIDDILEQLQKDDPDDETMQPRINSILHHAMTVSKSCSSDDSEKIARNCHGVLQQFNQLRQALLSYGNSPSEVSMASDLLRDYVELLEQSVNHALLTMMVVNLSTCNEPLEQLWRKCSSTISSADSRNKSDLDQDLHLLDQVVEGVLQTGFFALASTADLQKIQDIRCALYLLESMEAEVVPAVYSCYLDPDDKAAELHLKFLVDNFKDSCKSLQDNLDSIADPLAFCHVSEKVLVDRVTTIRDNLYTQDELLLHKTFHEILSVGRRCVSVLKQTDWSSTDKIFMKEIRFALDELRGSVSLSLTDVSNLRNQKSAMKRCELLLKYLMKSTQALARLQDSELAEGTFRVDSVTKADLPVDETTLIKPSDHSSSSKIRSCWIGRTPGRKIRRPSMSLGLLSSKELVQVTRYIDGTQPWRTPRTIRNVHVDDSQVSQADISDTFDLTKVLDDLSSLDSSLASNYQTSSQVTMAGSSEMVETVAVDTPQRLVDLKTVVKRLQFLKQHRKSVGSV